MPAPVVLFDLPDDPAKRAAGIGIASCTLRAVPPPKLVARLLAPQFALPTGLVGRVVGRLMNRNNRRMNAFTIEALNLRPTDHVLEIGFGGGLNLAPIAARIPDGHVVGVEPSDAMLASGRKAQSHWIANGRMRLERGSVERLPAADASFDAACSVNTIYFWKDAEAGAKEIYRVLRAGGRVAITLLPADRMQLLDFPREVFRYWSVEDVQGLLGGAAFEDPRVMRPSDPTMKWLCVTATKGVKRS